ncbi:hypothetical protein [Bythopirellula goksoeyrii]|uniref:Uncharacterized protein n=1 Tax=Bythopirellula goksoeyrii TaxID=1400387 RepID=A0A5B9QRK5_9BACT|nr:hypothetical protein [Bythopirellula goksoeyrii]QEG36761.1 hypothetical protein Pr1d_40970 [Bythopirellula goksoeyrii]
MSRQINPVRVLVACLSISLVFACCQSFGRGGKGGGGRSPGGSWSQKSHGGSQSRAGGQAHTGGQYHSGGRSAENRGGRNASQASRTQGLAGGADFANRRGPQASGAQGAAGGAAIANRRGPQESGAEGAAGGAALAKRRGPQASGAQGAAAGAAVSKRNEPQYSGAQGAAAGAAVSNRNQPQYSGAQGAAAGAAVSKRNAPQYSGAQGAAAGAAVADRNEPAMSGAAGYAAIQNSFDNPNMFGRQWYGNHPTAWAPSAWTTGAAWAGVSQAGIARHFGYSDATPISYDYGVNVTCENDEVTVDGENMGTAEEFSQQAADLANLGSEASEVATDRWLALGVYAMVRNEQQHPQLILQLAINEKGILRGNFTDEITDRISPIHGAVDKKTQRAAWTVGDNHQTVMEAGLNNLTDSSAPALVHKNGKTDHWLLVRLNEPPQNGDVEAGSGPAE